MGRLHYYKPPNGEDSYCSSLSNIKKLLKKQGGTAYTTHYDRSGSIQEVTPIVLGNNADTTYRAISNNSRRYKKNNFQ
ncbi:MAG: hypothetical protein EZS28_046233, partial [Streblomastix strix]